MNCRLHFCWMGGGGLSSDLISLVWDRKPSQMWKHLTQSLACGSYLINVCKATSQKGKGLFQGIWEETTQAEDWRPEEDRDNQRMGPEGNSLDGGESGKLSWEVLPGFQEPWSCSLTLTLRTVGVMATLLNICGPQCSSQHPRDLKGEKVSFQAGVEVKWGHACKRHLDDTCTGDMLSEQWPVYLLTARSMKNVGEGWADGRCFVGL